MKTILIATMSLALSGALLGQDAAVLTRGKYLVEDVAKCQECHTARTATGEPDKTKWLKGGVLDTKPVAEIPKWHASTPDITSTSALWQRWGVDGLVKFLETGKNPRGARRIGPCPRIKCSTTTRWPW